MDRREIQVLLVEDSLQERRLVGLELSEIEEPLFRTQEASRLSEAMAELRKGRTDVVLLDLSLPDADRLQGLVRLFQEFPTLPIVVFTGLDDQDIALQALREGAQDFLVKGQTEPGVLRRVLLHAIERKRVDVALNDSRESLREAQRLETLGRLAGKIAHDFNNILTTVVGFSDLLLEDLQGTGSVDDLMEIKKAGERGAALTSNILSFSRRERPTLEALSLNETVLGVCGMLGQLLPKQIKLELDLTPDLPLALADLGQVEQALVNLVTNARDAMDSDGVIKVRTEMRQVKEPRVNGHIMRPGTYLAAVVEDNGSGMDSATLDRVFEPFFTTKPRGAGTGLGLSTVISIVRGCGGGIEVSSVPGQGTSFALLFPLFETAVKDIDSLTPPEHVAASGLDIAHLPDGREIAPPVSETNGKGPGHKPGQDDLALWGGMSKGEMSEHIKHLYHVVSHDFHEPLRMVNSYLGLVKRRGRDNLDADMVEFIDYAVDGGQRMQGMLDSVLRYSRSLKSPPLAEPHSLKQVYETVLLGFPDTRAVRWEGEQPTLRASSDHLAAILRELISNALKFADPQHPEVVVSCQASSDRWLIQVRDNGPGLAENDVERCFRLFGRLHGRDEYPGLGVGLTIAQCLAEKYEAELTITTPPQGGSSANLSWPMAQESSCPP